MRRSTSMSALVGRVVLAFAAAALLARRRRRARPSRSIPIATRSADHARRAAERGREPASLHRLLPRRGEVTNVAPENDLLQGRRVGRLFGPNTTRPGGTSWFVEQRLIPFFVFEPKILDRMARLRASFELNWTWGDATYSVGGNFGGALNGRRSTSRRRTWRSRSNAASAGTSTSACSGCGTTSAISTAPSSRPCR